MMKRFLSVILLALPLFAGDVRYVAGNLATDLWGTPDTRPGCWGRAGVQTWTITFTPPPGKVVRIWSIEGDMVAWAKGAVQPGDVSGVLAGFKTTAPDGSTDCDLCSSNTPLYVQDAVSAQPRTRVFRRDLKDGLVLIDGKLVVVFSDWLNDTQRTIHGEVTYMITYQFEDAK
jgi:hypothetical protein